jgi:hypothetical protein
MSSIPPRKQPVNKPSNQDNLPSDVEEAPVKITPKEQFKYGDVKVTSPGVGRVSIVIH